VKLFRSGKDGGAESTVWGYWAIEAKKLCSAVLLRFEDGTRDADHDHAFNAISWVLKGRLIEHHTSGLVEIHTPSWRPVVTRRSTFHRVRSVGRTWVLSFRGPWNDVWHERVGGQVIGLTHGRRPAPTAGGAR
jgi:hypothetical protein